MELEKLKILFEKIKKLETEKFSKDNRLEREQKYRKEKEEFLKGIEIIKEQPTKDKPIIVENYPYGFKRTQIKYYVETNKRGDRFISQTLNPKTQKWNKEKKGTYSPIIIVYKDLSNNHIKYYTINNNHYLYTTEHFILSGFDFMSKEQKEQLKTIITILYTNCFISVSMVDVTLETETEREQRKQKDKKNMEEIKKLYSNIFYKEFVR